jgi:hypothetical protein
MFFMADQLYRLDATDNDDPTACSGKRFRL